MWKYFSNRVGNTFFRTTGGLSEKDFLVKNAIIGPLRLRQMSVKTQNCMKFDNAYLDIPCYPSTYDDSTKSKK